MAKKKYIYFSLHYVVKKISSLDFVGRKSKNLRITIKTNNISPDYDGKKSIVSGYKRKKM